MAVPKKRTSKSKKNLRKATWKKKILKQAMRALLRSDKEVSNTEQSKALE